MQKIIKSIAIVIVILLLSLVGFVQGSYLNEQRKTYSPAKFEIQSIVSQADVQLGKRLYTVRNGCIDCHGTDLSGKIVMDNAPMGTIRGSNLTPASLSSWSDEEIARAIRYGVHKTGRPLQFMPAFDFQGLSIGDIAALVAYLRSVPAQSTNFPKNEFGPVAKVLSALGEMPVMFPAKIIDMNQGFSEKPPEGPTKDFGKYLTQSCVGCHGAELRGGKIPGGDPSWPPASNIRLGGRPQWDYTSFANTIATGKSPGTNEALRPPMPIALLQQMNTDEVKAIWEYLSTLN